MKIVRILIYEGDDKFLQKCLRDRAVVVEKVFSKYSEPQSKVREFFVSQFPVFNPLTEFEELLPSEERDKRALEPNGDNRQ